MLGKQRSLGRIMPDEQKAALSILRMGNKNAMWRGDSVGYSALHGWVKKHLIKSDLCDMCGLVKPYDLSNKGVYDRDFNNWEWLCRKCHMNSDGRLDKFIKRNKTR